MEIALAIIIFLVGVLVSHLYHRKSTCQLQEYNERLESYLKRIEANQKAMLIRDERGKIMDVIITPESDTVRVSDQVQVILE
jgi:hypothetical protein